MVHINQLKLTTFSGSARTFSGPTAIFSGFGSILPVQRRLLLEQRRLFPTSSQLFSVKLRHGHFFRLSGGLFLVFPALELFFPTLLRSCLFSQRLFPRLLPTLSQLFSLKYGNTDRLSDFDAILSGFAADFQVVQG